MGILFVGLILSVLTSYLVIVLEIMKAYSVMKYRTERVNVFQYNQNPIRDWSADILKL